MTNLYRAKTAEQIKLPVRGFEGSTAGRSATETVVAPKMAPAEIPDAPVQMPGPAGRLDSRWQP